jgi:ankyrin repeat protein/lipoprotein NlpI
MKSTILTTLIISLVFLSQIQTSFAQTANELVAHAKTSIDKKDYAAAVTDSTAAIKLDANNADAFFWRGYAYYNQKDYPNALRDLDESIRLNPQGHLPFGARGIIRYRQKDFDNAIADYSKAIELNPKYQTGYYNRGVAIIHKPTPDWNAALADFTMASELNPQDSAAFFHLGFVYSSLENWKESEKNYLQSAALGDKTAELLANLSYVDIKLGAYAQAAMNARAALEIDPENKNATANLDYAVSTRQKPFDAPLARELLDAANDNDTNKAISAINRGADVNATYTYNDFTLSTALQRAASRGNFFLVRALVSVGAKVNAQDSFGSSPLHFAAGYSKEYGDKGEIVKYLLKNKADVNLADSRGSIPLHAACLWGYDDMVELLLKAGSSVKVKNNQGATPLIVALSGGTDQAVQLLLTAGADPNTVDNNGYQALLFAVRKNGFGLAKAYFLMKAGAVIDLTGDPKISAADTEAIAYVNLIKTFAADSVETKLFDAATSGNQPELISLLAANPSINKTILNYLLMISIYQNSPTLLEALLAKGADPNFQMDGTSVLKMAQMGKFTGVSAAYLANYATDNSQANRVATQNETARLINEATGLMKLATTEMNAAFRRRDEGADKSIWCLRVEAAANDVNYAIKNLDRALLIAPFDTKAEITTMKQAAVNGLRDISSKGCPIFLK